MRVLWLGLVLVLTLTSPALAGKVWDTPIRSDLTDDVASTAGAGKRTSDATYINNAGVLTTSTGGDPSDPRIGYDGVLVEGPATNYCLYSSFSVGWSNSGTTQSLNVTGPDGVENSALTVTDPGGASFNGIYSNPITTLTNNLQYTQSVNVKQGTSGTFSLFIYDFTAPATRADVDFQWTGSTLSVKAENIGTGGVRQVNSTWWLAWVACPTSVIVGANNNSFRIYPSEAGVDPGGSVTTIFHSPQLELGLFPTSRIPTTTAPVSRTTEAADAGDVGYSWTTPAAVTTILSGSVDGTLVFDWTPHYDEADGTGTVSIISWDDSTSSGVYTTHGSDLNITDGTNTATVTLAWVANQTYPIAVYWDTGNSDLKIGWFGAGAWTWGATVDYDGAFAVTDGKIKLGYGNAYPFSIKGIRFYDEDLTDTDPAVTVSANNMTYRNQLYNGENCYEGIHINNGVTGTLVQNCTFVNFNGPALNTLADVTVENCLFFENLGDIEITTGDTVTGNNNAIEDWQARGAGTYTDTDSIFSNLDAVADREAGNFRLKRGNAAIDAGKDLSGTYTTDINSLPWERGAGFDIGCYSRFWYNADMGTPLKINGEDPGYIYKYNGNLSTNAP